MLKTIVKIAAIAMAAAMLFSCEKPAVPELKLSDKVANFDASGDLTRTIGITANYTWSAVNTADWLSLDKSSGDGNGTLTITAQENKSFEVRTAAITVMSEGLTEEIAVTQISSTPSLLISPESAEVPCAGGTVTVQVTANVKWTVDNPSEWMEIDKLEGENSGSFTITLPENNTIETRGAVIVVENEAYGLVQMIEVLQLAAEPVLKITPETVSQVSNDGGEVTLEVECNFQWGAVASEEWISLSKTGGEGTGTVVVTVEPNIYPSSRTASIKFEGHTVNMVKSIEITQGEAPLSRQTDSLALVAIYNASNGANWKADRVWDLTKSIDTWYGIKLDADGRVTQLKCLANTITEDWTVPAEIGYLQELTDLRFNNCCVAGNLPEEVYSLTKLQFLYFQNNKLTGSLSSKLGALTELTQLYIDQNENLGGSIPKEIGNLTKLANINISKTKIGGTIPAEMGACVAMANFMAYNTELESPVPDIFGNFKSLGVIQLNNNPKMTGALPETFGKLSVTSKNLSLWLYGCNFEGNIPESYANLPSVCKQFRVQDNKLSGVVPAAVQAHAQWNTWTPAKYILPQQDGYGLTVE